MTASIEVLGVGELKRQLGAFPVELRKAAAKAVAQTAAAIQNRYVKAVQHGGRSGRPYTRYAPKRTGQASAPGEPPKTDTGRLASSAAIDLAGVSTALEAQVVVSAPYASALEFGSPGRNLAPRPALGPAAKAERPLFGKRVAAAVAEATAKVRR